MSDSLRIWSFYRVAKRYPPSDGEYRTAQDRSGDPTPESSPEVKACWNGLSANDTEEAARQQAVRMKGRLGRLIVRYDIPKEELKRYLSGFVVEV